MTDITCSVCRVLKSQDEFYRDASRKSGYMIRCKSCEGARQRRRYTVKPKPPCAECGSRLPKGRRVVCSDRCSVRRLMKSDAYLEAQARRDPDARYPWHTLTCEQCGETWKTRNRDGRFCSMTCYGLSIRRPAEVELYYGEVAPRSFLPKLHPARRPIEKPCKPRTFVEGPCGWCGDRFTVVDQLQARYCSPNCSSSAGKARRGRFLVAPSVRRAIYERDGWVCQLCDDPVDPELHPSDPWAATLDHIVPRSWTLVPDDSPQNLRLAHRWCNSVRGDERYYTEEVLRSGETAA